MITIKRIWDSFKKDSEAVETINKIEEARKESRREMWIYMQGKCKYYTQDGCCKQCDSNCCLDNCYDEME